MSFVLSRTDVPEIPKLALKDRVVQIIGRGSLRDCNDPRISREHASVTTKGKTLILRAIHLKPCFYRRRFSDALSKLSLGESVELFHGDCFGLLPETNWYELIYLKNEDAEDDEDKAEEQNKNIQPDPNEAKNEEQSTPTKRPHTPDKEPVAKKIKTEPESPMTEGTISTSNIAVGETQDNTEANYDHGSTQILTQDRSNVAKKIYPGEPTDVSETDKEHDNDITNAESMDLNDTVNSDDVNQAGYVNKEYQRPDTAIDSSNNIVNVYKDVTSDSQCLSNPTDSVHSSGDKVTVKTEPDTPTKESAALLETSGDTNSDNTGILGHNDQQGSDTEGPSSGSEVDVKKEVGMAGADNVKKEAGTTGADNVKKEPQSPDAAQPGTSNDQPGQAGPSNDGAAPAPPVAAPRERCMYGTHCYRKNPQHKMQYSHPSDADYGTCERAQCPYGAQCHRTDPRHWTSHTHPPGTLPPMRSRNGIRVVQRRGQFFYINAHAVHFHDNHYAVEDEDGQRVDYDYEF